MKISEQLTSALLVGCGVTSSLILATGTNDEKLKILNKKKDTFYYN